MHGTLESAGERLAIDCAVPWVARLLVEGADGELRDDGDAPPTVTVRVEASRQPFLTRGWTPLTRGAWRRHGEVVVENACTSGFDLHLRCAGETAEFAFRWRPPARDRGAAWALRSRFHLLARAVLMQFPALWRAGMRGRAPLHASACAVARATPLLAAASGVGRSTLLLRELAAGGRATGDNLSVADGRTVWGLVEPLRVDAGSGRRMPHGRREAAMPGRVGALEPDRLVVLERGGSQTTELTASRPDAATRSLIAGTYMAGELRRYWSLAATLAAGTGVGPAHPPVVEVAWALATELPCFTLTLGRTGSRRLSELLHPVEVLA